MQILMPKVGLTMTEGTIVQWHKREGEFVAKGEALFTFETEKSTLEFESPAEGALTQILAPAGQVVACLVPVAEIGGEGRGAKSEGREAGGVIRHESQVISHKSGGSDAHDLAFSTSRRPISPRAKLRAGELGIDVNTIVGTGPDGALRERDVVEASNVKRQMSNADPREVSSPKPIRATPVALRIAEKRNLDLSQITGTGRAGLITREDVEERGASSVEREMLSSDPLLTPHAPRSTPLFAARRITAQRMTENSLAAPHVTLTTEADASALVSAREQLNAELGEKISYNALLIAIVAKALREHPGVNASWVEETIDERRPTADKLAAAVSRRWSVVQHPSINIGLAVDTPRGLLVPVLRDCETKSLAQIHHELGELVARALAGKTKPDELGNGTFTITNLGAFEIDAFTPIINLPEAAILGVGRIVKKAVVVDDDRIVPRHMLTLSLSFDHRVIDGAPAAKFLQRIKQLVERPMALLISK